MLQRVLYTYIHKFFLEYTIRIYEYTVDVRIYRRPAANELRS